MREDTAKVLVKLVSEEGFMSPQEVQIGKNDRTTISFTMHTTEPDNIEEEYFTETGRGLREVFQAAKKYGLQQTRKRFTNRDTRQEVSYIGFELNPKKYLVAN